MLVIVERTTLTTCLHIRYLWTDIVEAPPKQTTEEKTRMEIPTTGVVETETETTGQSGEIEVQARIENVITKGQSYFRALFVL
jgi:hypothetical protein